MVVTANLAKQDSEGASVSHITTTRAVEPKQNVHQ
jgi:hypothetical protein